MVRDSEKSFPNGGHDLIIDHRRIWHPNTQCQHGVSGAAAQGLMAKSSIRAEAARMRGAGAHANAATILAS